MSITLSQMKDRDRILIIEAGRLHPAVSFSRAGAAQVMNGVGNLVTTPVNLILQSDALTTSPWTSSGLVGGTGVAPVVTVNFAVAPDGKTTATRIQLNKGAGDTLSDISGFGQTISVTIGSVYTLNGWVKANGAGDVGKVILMRGIAGSYKAVTLTADWQRVTQATATTASSGLVTPWILRGANGSSDSADFLVWQPQYELGAVPTPYIPTTTTICGAPRFEYDGSGNYLGLLVEESRTNLLLNSDSTLAQLNMQAGTSNAASPLATYFTNSIQFPASSGTSNYAYKTRAVTSGLPYTFSVFVKMNNAAVPVVGVTISSGDMGVVLFGGLAVSTVTHMGGDVYRISCTGTAPTTATQNFGIVSYVGQTQKAFRITGYQLEQASSVTSYIPTAAATVTRASELLTASSLSAIGVNSNEGTFVCIARQGTWIAAQQTYFILYDGTGNNRIQVRRETATSVNVGLTITGGAAQTSIVQTVGTDGARIKLAMGYKLNDFAGSCNGLAISTDTIATLPTVNRLDIGTFGPGGNVLNGYIEYLAYYPKKRPNVEFPGLST